MKLQQKLNIVFILIIVGLLIAVFSLFFSENNALSKDSNFIINEEFQLMEIHQQQDIVLSGIISPSIVEEVQMKVSGTIDGENRSLAVGSTFKKNEILIKVERLEAIYDLLAARTEYKTLIQKLILSIKEEVPNEFEKWNAFDNKIQKTIPLPDLPRLKSKREELLVNKLNVISEYYKTKNAERKIEDYIHLAPFDGIIIDSKITPGSSFQTGKPILKLAKNDTHHFLAHANMEDLNRIYNKDTITLQTSKGDDLGKGIFLRTGTFNLDSSMVEVYFSILSKDNSLFNQAAEIHYLGKKTSIPNRAIQDDSISLFKNNIIYKSSVRIIKKIGDSSLIEGLPQHGFVIIHKK